MKPNVLIAKAEAPDGSTFTLYKHDGQFALFVDNRQVMSTTLTHSELMLADIGCDFKVPRKQPRVMIGGLGLGYSLRRVLEITDAGAKVVVAELLPDIVKWNREHLDGLNDDILSDTRTDVQEADVFHLLLKAAKTGTKYDAILLDVDDGPTSLIQSQNFQLYNRDGLRVLHQALTPGGRVAIWAAGEESRLLKHLRKAGFRCEETACAKHPKAKQKIHRIYLGERKD